MKTKSVTNIILLFPAFFVIVSGLAFKADSTTKPASRHGYQNEPTNRTATPEQIENQAFELVNGYRKSIGLSPLTRNEAAIEQARKHSQDMAHGRTPFGHEGAAKRIEKIGKTLSFMSAGAENVFECSRGFNNLAKEALNGWLQSPGHKKNMEGDYNLSGMGVAIARNGDYYFTQIFVKGNL